MSAYNLPVGCTQTGIDRAYGYDQPVCAKCGDDPVMGESAEGEPLCAACCRIEARVNQAMAEQDRMIVNCRCEWDEGYLSHWNPDCPEHDEPEDGDFHQWIEKDRRRREDRAIGKYHRISYFLKGLEKIYSAMRHVPGQKHGDPVSVYATLFALRNSIQDEIQKIAREI